MTDFIENKTNNRIVLKHIYKTYNQKKVLDIDYAEIPLDGIVAIIGWSGSGKSTLINILSLLDHPDLDKKDITPSIQFYLQNHIYTIEYKNSSTKPKISKNHNNKIVKIDENEFRRELFGYVFQEDYLHPNLTVEYNIKTPLIVQSKTISKEDLDHVCKIFEINDHLKKYVNEVSGGQKQRASILRSMTKDCKIVFGDELTNNLDDDNANKILKEFENQLEKEDKNLQSFLWVSHNIHLIEKFAKKIVTIKFGKLECVDNDFENANEIIEHLRSDSDIKCSNNSLKLNKEPAKFSELVKYYISYSYNDLFKHVCRPTVDFMVVVLSLTFLLLFLLSILKISYGSYKYLELTMSDPRINSLEVSGSEKIGGELKQSHYEDMKQLLKDSVRYVTPVYYVRTSLKDLKYNSFKSVGNAITFRKDDPVIKEVLGEKSAPFINSKDNWNGLIIRKNVLERAGYTSDVSHINAKFNGFNDTGEEKIPVLMVNVPLPFDKKVMMREEFYLNSYKKLYNEETPYLAYIVIYPNNIYDTVAIKEKIEQAEIFDINDAFKVLNKMKILDEIKNQTSLFVDLSLWAICVMAFLFITVTIYKNMYKKRKEIGVFLAYGMKKGSFYIFYLLEAFIINVTAFIISITGYKFAIEPLINKMLVSGSLLKIVGTSDMKTTINFSELSIPFDWMAIIYVFTFLILTLIFVCLVFYFTTKMPVKLMKEVS